jgi:hypothetical protein
MSNNHNELELILDFPQQHQHRRRLPYNKANYNMCYPATVVAANLLNTPISCSSSTRTADADDCPLPPQKINRYTDLEQHDEDRQDLPHFPQLACLADGQSSPNDNERPHRPRLLQLQLQQRKRSFTEYQLSLETNNKTYIKSTIDLSSESLTTLSFKSLSLSTTPKYFSPK